MTPRPSRSQVIAAPAVIAVPSRQISRSGPRFQSTSGYAPGADHTASVPLFRSSIAAVP
ncbi:hypothetical protein D3C83_213570 [compost metagenome]